MQYSNNIIIKMRRNKNLWALAEDSPFRAVLAVMIHDRAGGSHDS